MLNASLLADMRNSYAKVIDTLGTPLTWTQAVGGGTGAFVCGMAIAGDKDEALVNSYGVGARIITVKATDFPVAPSKFDKFSSGTEVYVAEAVHPVHLNAGIVGYRVIIKGR